MENKIIHFTEDKFKGQKIREIPLKDIRKVKCEGMASSLIITTNTGRRYTVSISSQKEVSDQLAKIPWRYTDLLEMRIQALEKQMETILKENTKN